MTGQRIAARDELLYALGMLVAPIQRAVDEGSVPPAQIAVLRARFQQDLKLFKAAATNYCTLGTLFLDYEYQWITAEAKKLGDCLGPLGHPEIQSEAARCVSRALRNVKERIARVPVEQPSEILPTTPYQTYLRLRSLILSAIDRVELFDPYLDAPVFHRYLSDVSESVQLRVVTPAESLAVGTTDRRALARRDRIVSVSELLADERPTSYTLIATTPFHDRHLRVDTTTLQLGGSLKDASRNDPFTISSQTPGSDSILDGLIASGEEWFGPNTTVHRRA